VEVIEITRRAVATEFRDVRVRAGIVEQLAQDRLSAAIADLHGQRDARGHLRNAMVEEGHARLEAHGHRRAVDLAQHVVRQIAEVVTTGEGGMAMTNDPALAARMRLLRSHGQTRDPALFRDAPDGPWYYEQVALGYNYRMTDMQAALGHSQLQRLDRFVDRRRQLAALYDEAFAGAPLTRPSQHPDTRSSFHLYIIRVDAAAHRPVFDRLRHAGIGVNLHYIPIPRQPYYRDLGFDPAGWPEAERYYSEAISLPLYPDLREEEQDRVIAEVKDALGCA